MKKPPIHHDYGLKYVGPWLYRSLCASTYSEFWVRLHGKFEIIARFGDPVARHVYFGTGVLVRIIFTVWTGANSSAPAADGRADCRGLMTNRFGCRKR